MFLEIFAAAALAATPATDPGTAPAAPAVQQPVQNRRICRIRPAPTGSNRRDGRVCKTEAEWRVLDRADADLSSAGGGSPTRSSGNRDDD